MVRGAPGAQALHLRRLSAATPEWPVALPGGRAHSLSLSAPQPGGAGGVLYLCLEGRVLLDLPHGDFVQLKTGEAHHVAAGTEHVLTPLVTSLLLLVSDGG